MSTALLATPKEPMTIAAFEAWIKTLPKEQRRFELVGGFVVEMQSESLTHALTKGELGYQFESQIRSKKLDCRYIPDRVAIAIGDKNWYEPDGFVFCGPLPPDDDVWKLVDATIIVEIDGPGKSRVSALSKMHQYFAHTNAAHFLALDLLGRTLTHIRRREGDPAFEIAGVHRGGVLALDPPGLSLDLDAVFAAADR